ncbi:hypothetical protein OUZ56_018898 [Daphnia magna]|uniref:Uncharacterized protein n=1 Tax=Daphnia magna TaxID=35525 RepID=A0ABQ9ZA34_9CRUS|nr:hypothetical protein OUZ56_018898 [Daphnia magna]
MNTQKTVKDKKKRELGHKVGQLRSDTGILYVGEKKKEKRPMLRSPTGQPTSCCPELKKKFVNELSREEA